MLEPFIETLHFLALYVRMPVFEKGMVYHFEEKKNHVVFWEQSGYVSMGVYFKIREVLPGGKRE